MITDASTGSESEWCHEALDGTSRTFAITVDLLDEPMATQICVSYLLCRVADTIEDAGHIPPETQSTLLRTYDRALDPDDDLDIAAFERAVDPWLPDEGGEDWRVVANASRVVRAFEALAPDARAAVLDPIRELVSGMALFVERHADTDGLRIETVEELEEYCWYAAGTVGTLVTNLLARDAAPERVRELREHDRAFSLLLQLVNVAKDVSDDYREENNVYLPATWLREAGVDPERVCDSDNTAAVAGVIRRVAGRARNYAGDARRYLDAAPETNGNTLAAWAVPYLLALGTLRELDANAEDVLREGGVKISRAEVLAVVSRFAGDERPSLEALGTTIASQPYHAASKP
ncbi:phytoene/squalene synthase family protein [Halococcus sediminicola]|uniref:phytoene/squalene synthase family protein n=1 Tax=Halococcus sediminicola TaxID=1264579 RepID=UPI0006795DE1|nr:phytoene/squalene synthase family protein [Halococcus sediminicola]